MKFSKTNQWSFRAAFMPLAAMLVLLFGLGASAQQITGSIAGTVKDEQGALVPTATSKRSTLTRALPAPSPPREKEPTWYSTSRSAAIRSKSQLPVSRSSSRRTW